MGNQTSEPDQNEQARPLPASGGSGKPDIDYALLELLERWEKEDATDDPEKILAAEKDLEEFKRAMNENRTSIGGMPIYP